MGGVKLVLRQDVRNADFLTFPMPVEPYRSRLQEVLDRCWEKSNGFVSITIDRPYKPRTTGEKSQNNLFWKIATIISNETGEDVKEIERQLKMKAISKGYPYHVSKVTGEPVPESMTTINTVEMSYLIDTAYEVCAFLGIVLEPELKKEEPAPAVEIRPVYPVNIDSLAGEALQFADDDIDISEGELF